MNNKFVTIKTDDKFVTIKTDDKFVTIKTDDKFDTTKTNDRFVTTKTNDKFVTIKTDDKFVTTKTNDTFVTIKKITFSYRDANMITISRILHHFTARVSIGKRLSTPFGTIQSSSLERSLLTQTNHAKVTELLTAFAHVESEKCQRMRTHCSCNSLPTPVPSRREVCDNNQKRSR